jgi:DNA-binding response OmpR family regulator
MSSPKVLVIDDSASTCLLIATALRQAHYEVATARNGQMGVALIMSFRPHCLVLDVLLPDTTGYALCRQIRQSSWGQTLPLILMSAKGDPLDVNYGLRQGASRYLTKPFTTDTLLREVWAVIPKPARYAVSPPPPSVSQQPTLPALAELIPRRAVSQQAMLTSNPFAPAFSIRDGQSRRLYAAIDGKKTVIELASATGLKTEEVVNMLRQLLREHIIQLYTSTGQFLEASL